MPRSFGKIFLVPGLLLITAAILLPVLRGTPVGLAVAIAVPGIVLIVLGWAFGRVQTTLHPVPEILQTLYSIDRKMRATVRRRTDGHYQVEYWALTYSHAEHGLEPQYIRSGGSSVADSLAGAVDLASEHLRTGG